MNRKDEPEGASLCCQHDLPQADQKQDAASLLGLARVERIDPARPGAIFIDRELQALLDYLWTFQFLQEET